MHTHEHVLQPVPFLSGHTLYHLINNLFLNIILMTWYQGYGLFCINRRILEEISADLRQTKVFQLKKERKEPSIYLIRHTGTQMKIIYSYMRKNEIENFSNLFLAPGGTLSEDAACTEFCVFKAQEDMKTMQAYAQVSALVFVHLALLAQERWTSQICNHTCFVL